MYKRQAFENVFVVKYDASGNVIWARSPDECSVGFGYNISTDLIGNVYITGIFGNSDIVFGNTALTSSGLWNIFVAKLSPPPIVTDLPLVSGADNFNIYPNPSSGIFTLNMNNILNAKVFVYDTHGNSLFTKDCRNETNPQIDLSNQSKGIYFVEMVAGNERRTEKIIIQ